MMAAPQHAVRTAFLTFALVVSSVPAALAQAPVESFAELPGVLKTGTIVYVQDEQGQRTKGKIRELAPSSITLFTIDGHRQERSFPADRVARISRVDSRLNGFLIGVAGGAAAGLWLGAGLHSWCLNESPGESADRCWTVWPIAGVPFALIGGWIGFEIDDAINGQSLVFRRQGPGPAAKIHVAPVLTGRSTGARISITF
jgi:hypothetical protein